MSKRFRGKLCIYCLNKLSTNTGDHVFARKFFPKSERADLPKVPACESCGNEKSQAEHYLTTVLPFGARHDSALANLKDMVPDRLRKNAKLHRELAEGSGTMLTEEHPGFFVPTMTVPFDNDRLHNFFRFVVKGLLWHHWAISLQSNHGIKIISLTKAGESVFSKLLSMNSKQQVSANLGNGVFIYEGTQGIDYPEFSLWKISIYNGLKLSGDPTAPLEEFKALGIVTGDRQFLQLPHVVSIFG